MATRTHTAPAAGSTKVACAHCGLPVPNDLVDAGAGPSFCCNGCRAVFETLAELGLDGYYELRDTLGRGDDLRPAPTPAASHAVFDRESFTRDGVRALDGGLSEVEFMLEGVHCAACVWLVERLPRALPGAIEARLRLSDAVVKVVFDPARTQPSQVARALDRLGYAPHPVRGEERREIERRADRRRLVRLGVAGACAGNAMLLAFALYAGASSDMEPLHMQLFRWSSLGIGAIALLWPGREFFRGALAALRTRTPNLDVPIALALLAGGLAGAVNTVRGSGEIYFDSLCVLVFLLLVGRHVQQRQQRWARDAVDLTRALTPLACRVQRGEVFEDIATFELVPGDVVEVPSGGLVPADGVVTSGSALVDEALLSGESEPISVAPGSRVHAGTRVDGAPLLVAVDAVGADSRIGRLMSVVEQGLAEKPPITRLLDRVSGWFVSVLTVVSALTFASWWWLADIGVAVEHTVAVLIVACPCALGLATPLTLAVAVGRAAKRGLLVKDAGALERLAEGGRIVLDKTGTLTTGRPSLVEWIGPDATKQRVAALEARSNHPIARALVQGLSDDLEATRRTAVDNIVEKHDGGIGGRVEGRELQVGSPRFVVARGCAVPAELGSRSADLEALGHTVVQIAEDGQVVAVAALLDTPRPGVRAALAELRGLGFDLEICSGDATGPVRRVAELLDVPSSDTFAAVDPEGKLARVAALHEAGRRVVMVGDGVNDAAALAAADVGVAVHGGAEASLAAADVFASRPGLEPLLDLVAIARRTFGTIKLNLGLSLTYNLVVGTLAVTGHVDALVAAIVMPISSATVLAVAMGSLARPLRRRANNE